jgi:hypothetical protein
VKYAILVSVIGSAAFAASLPFLMNGQRPQVAQSPSTGEAAVPADFDATEDEQLPKRSGETHDQRRTDEQPYRVEPGPTRKGDTTMKTKNSQAKKGKTVRVTNSNSWNTR